MRFEEPIEPESVCRVTFSGGVVLAESLVLKGKAKSVRRRRKKSDSRSNSDGGFGCRVAGICPNCAGAVCRGSKEAGTSAKNVGVEETDPRRPHFVVTGESAGVGKRDR